MFNVSIVLVSLIDEHRQWFKSRQGLEACETSRDISFCGHAILSEQIFEVSDARADPRFADNPLVTGAPHIRFYAGAPLYTHSGFCVGTLCLIDQHAKTLTAEQKLLLRSLADCVQNELNLQLDLQLQSLLRQSEARNDAILKVLPDAIYVINDTLQFTDCNNHPELFSPRNQLIGQTIQQVLPTNLAVLCQKALQQVLATGKAQRFSFSLPTAGAEQYFDSRMQLLDQHSVLWLVHNCTTEQVAQLKQQSIHRLTAAIAQMHSGFLKQDDRDKAYQAVLADVLKLTNSEYGFIGEVLRKADGSPYLKMYFSNSSAGIAKSRTVQSATAIAGNEISNLDSLYGA
ncbi:MAG TPA: GAF domain-containing protein, partial [Rheinheimera sp.]|nr:GAF domain-containing protein [Rheinheimera sp.]